MLRTDLPALIDSAGVLNTPALARVLRSTKISLVFIERVVPKSDDEADKYACGNQDIFYDALHKVFRA